MGNTIGDRDWAWENICFEQEQLEKKLRSKIQELLQLQTEHEFQTLQATINGEIVFLWI
jgi:hypothetical protein